MICRKSEVYHGKYPRSREKRKIFLYRFTACLGKDEKGRQIRRYRTWQVPQGLSPVRAERAAQRAADEWEKSLKIDPSEAEIPPAVHSCDFADFVNEVWLPLRIQNGTNKPVTVTFHRNNAKRLTEYFKGRSMQKITAIDIQRYLTYLRTEYRSTRGKPLATKTVCHLYATSSAKIPCSRSKRQERRESLLMRWTMKKPQDFSGCSRRYRLIFTVC